MSGIGLKGMSEAVSASCQIARQKSYCELEFLSSSLGYSLCLSLTFLPPGDYSQHFCVTFLTPPYLFSTE